MRGNVQLGILQKVLRRRFLSSVLPLSLRLSLPPLSPLSGGGETDDGPEAPRLSYVMDQSDARLKVPHAASQRITHLPFSANAKLIKQEERLMERCNSQTKAYIRGRWRLQGRAPLSIEKSCRAEDTTYTEINHSVGFYRSYRRVRGR